MQDKQCGRKSCERSLVRGKRSFLVSLDVCVSLQIGGTCVLNDFLRLLQRRIVYDDHGLSPPLSLCTPFRNRVTDRSIRCQGTPDENPGVPPPFFPPPKYARSPRPLPLPLRLQYKKAVVS